MNSLQINANAKINLALAVKYKREDGYHEIELIFQEIDFADRLTLSKHDEISFTTDSKVLSDAKSNLCTRAAHLLRKDSYIPGLKIHLEKNIPIGSGLGGGSSDAAAVLKGGLRLYNIDVPDSKIMELALEIGADVPFFIHGKTAYGEGIGERLTKIRINTQYYILLIVSNLKISTKWAYKNLKLTLTRKNCDFKFRGSRIQSLGLNAFRSEFYNDFEKLVFRHYPELEKLKTELYNRGASYSSLSGSGSVIFGLFSSKKLVERAYNSLKTSYRCIISKPIVDL